MTSQCRYIRDRPFNLKEGGGLWFLLRSEFVFRTTQEFEYFFLSGKALIFFPEFNIALYDKYSKSDYFVFLHQNQNIFFSNIGNQNIFKQTKNITHPHPFQVNWSFPNSFEFSTIIFYQSWKEGYLPKQWKQANV